MTDAISVKVEPKDKNVCTLTREAENMATVLRFSVVSWHILRVSFEAYVSNEQPLAEKTRMSSSLLNTSFDSTAS